MTGCSWDVAGRITDTSESTLRRRRDEWLAAGVFEALVDEALSGYERIIGLELGDLVVDGSLHKAPSGGEAMNLLVKKIKRCGHGFKSFSNYRLRVLLHCGGIKWNAHPARTMRARSPQLVA